MKTIILGGEDNTAARFEEMNARVFWALEMARHATERAAELGRTVGSGRRATRSEVLVTPRRGDFISASHSP